MQHEGASPSEIFRDLKTSAVWLENSFNPVLPTFEFPEKTEVAIVGSGYTGLHCAIALAKKGIQVTVLEKHTPGWGASHRNAGMVLPGWKATLQSLIQSFGLKRAQELWDWSLHAIFFVESFTKENKIECAFSRNGQTFLASKPQHLDQMKNEIQFMEKNFSDSIPRIVEKSALRSEIGSNLYYGALVDPRGAELNPAQYIGGLTETALREGVRIFSNTEMQKYSQTSTGFEIATSRGILKSEKLMIASNGYTGPFAGSIRDYGFPIGSYMIATEPLSENLIQEISPKNRSFFDSKNFLNYFRTTSDRRILFGGRHNLAVQVDPKESAYRLRESMIRAFPQLKDSKITHSWGGNLGFNYRMIPSVGCHQGVYFSIGCNGHGVGASSLLGREMGDWIATGQEHCLLSHCRPIRTKGYRFYPYFLGLVSAWYKMKDWVS